MGKLSNVLVKCRKLTQDELNQEIVINKINEIQKLVEKASKDTGEKWVYPVELLKTVPEFLVSPLKHAECNPFSLLVGIGIPQGLKERLPNKQRKHDYFVYYNWKVAIHKALIKVGGVRIGKMKEHVPSFKHYYFQVMKIYEKDGIYASAFKELPTRIWRF